MVLGLAQWVKDLVLPQLWCRSQPWLGSSSWPENFHMPQMRKKKKKNLGSVYYYVGQINTSSARVCSVDLISFFPHPWSAAA